MHAENLGALEDEIRNTEERILVEGNVKRERWLPGQHSFFYTSVRFRRPGEVEGRLQQYI